MKKQVLKDQFANWRKRFESDFPDFKIEGDSFTSNQNNMNLGIQFKIDNCPLTVLIEYEHFYLNPLCPTFKLRNEILPIIHDRDKYLAVGIELEDDSKINAFEFLRMLDTQYQNKLIASEFEIQERIPADIPKVLEINEWYHPDILADEPPSENETFKQIAAVLESGDIDYFKPTQQPNTHWVKWPEGGTL